MSSSDRRSNSPDVASTEPLLLKLPEEVLEHILLYVAGTDREFLVHYDRESWERIEDLESVYAVLLTCRRLVPAATRALYFSPRTWVSLQPRPATLERIRHRAWLFRKNLLGKPQLAGMIRNLTSLPRLVAALPPSGKIARTASAIAHSVGQSAYQRQVLQLVTAATSVGVVLTDSEDAFKVGAVLATRRLSHLRVAYEYKTKAQIVAFAAFLKKPALQRRRQRTQRPRRPIDRVRDLNYEVFDLEIAIAWVDIDQAAYFLPSDVAKLARLRCHLPFELERDPDLDYDLDGFNFDATRLEQRIKHNAIKVFAIESDITYEQEVPIDYYWEPEQYEVPTINYPLALFGLFPSLEELTLSHGGEMTVEKLELLADTSPNLKVLQLPDTYWTPDQSLHEGDSGELCPFDVQLMATLDRLNSLEVANLGLLPSHSKSPGKAFRRWAKKRKLKVIVNWCYDENDPDTREEFSGNDSSSA